MIRVDGGNGDSEDGEVVKVAMIEAGMRKILIEDSGAHGNRTCRQ